jgi:hypothetical protein
VQGPTIYVGGDFLNVGGMLHAHIAGIDATTGLPTSWAPSTDAAVYGLAVYGNDAYVGGGFSNVTGQTRFGLGAIDLTTGAATSWDPGTAKNSCTTCPGTVYALAISARQVYPFTTTVWVGGDFQWLGYFPSQTFRDNLAAIDAGTAAPTSWNPDASGVVDAVTLRRGTLGDVLGVYVGGSFGSVGGQPRSRIAELNGAGAVTSWAPNADARVNAIALGLGGVYAGGSFSNIGGQSRTNLAQLDATTGMATGWNANMEPIGGLVGGDPGAVEALASGNGLIYPGGTFFDALGLPHSTIAGITEAIAGAGVGEPPRAVGPGVLLAAPNPFHGHVNLHFELPVPDQVVAAIYDLNGRRVRTLHAGPLGPGAFDMTWDGRTDAGQELRSGVYFARVEGTTVHLSGRLLRIQ